MYAISVVPFLQDSKYVKIFTINKMPEGTLSNSCIRINPPKLSTFSEDSNCIIAFKSIIYPTKLMLLEELTDLTNLISLDATYAINYSFSKLMLENKTQKNKNIIFYIS